MKRIIDWYWEHGVNRPMEWTISSSGLNTIMGIANRDAAIQRMLDLRSRKSCVAFWGPSQSGKSSLLSHYIDGKYDSDLALMWDPAQKVRFSTYQGGEGVDAGCVVFNPFNCAMDASGLVTRFYLPTPEESAKIYPEAPVEVILANRKQVLHAIAVGYRMECQESENPWGIDQLRQKIGTPSVRPDRDAFELLYDVCDVCENMARENSRYREFARGPKLRQQILGSSYADNLNEAMDLASYLLWDKEQRLTDLFVNVMAVSETMDSVRDKNAPNRIFVSMEVASLLEDIGVLAFYEQNKNGHPSAEAQRKMAALDNIRMSVTPRGLIYTCNKKDPSDKTRVGRVSIEAFGRFQALIGELRIPLRKNASEAAKPFFDFLERCDLLDIPGVTNRASGEALGVENLISLSDKTTEATLLSRVYKSGKTLSIVYNQAESCSIDSFVIFVDLERAGGISRPTTIVNGVKAWLSPYGFTSFDTRPPLKLYLNCSLFGKLQDKVVAAVHGGGLANYCEKAAALDFTKSRYVDCFFTTNCFSKCTDKNKQHFFESDADFKSMFLGGSGQESLNALFADGLGTDYMFNRLTADVSTNERYSHYDVIRAKDHNVLKGELLRILPSGEGGTAALRKEVMKRVLTRVSEQVQADDPEKVRKLAAFVKEVFVVEEQMLEPIPKTPLKKHDTELKDYLIHQIHRWVAARKESLSGNVELNWLVSDDEIYPFLEALSTIDYNRIIALLKTDFWNHSPKISRTFLAMALNNCFLWGDYERRQCERRTDSYGMLCAPFVARLEQLSTVSYSQEGGRPSDLEGDAELLEIVQALKLA